MDEYDRNHDGRLNRIEFVRLCSNELWSIDEKTIDMAVENMRKARTSKVRGVVTHHTLSPVLTLTQLQYRPALVLTLHLTLASTRARASSLAA